MIYELRKYTCMPNRRPDVVERTAKDVLPLWERHGIEQVGAWNVSVGNWSNNAFIYLLRWESLADREVKWKEFMSDPDWVHARARTEANGALVESVQNQLLKPTAFSELQ